MRNLGVINVLLLSVMLKNFQRIMVHCISKLCGFVLWQTEIYDLQWDLCSCILFCIIIIIIIIIIIYLIRQMAYVM